MKSKFSKIFIENLQQKIKSISFALSINQKGTQPKVN